VEARGRGGAASSHPPSLLSSLLPQNSAGVGIFATDAAAARNRVPLWARAAAAARVAPPRDALLASFPLSIAVTPATALADPVLGAKYAALRAAGDVDDRALVMLHLAVERARGRASRLAPWLAALPREFGTPLHFDDADMALLAGTTLGKAAASLRARLSAAWARLAPAAADLAQAAGVPAAPTLADFQWAYSTFWWGRWRAAAEVATLEVARAPTPSPSSLASRSRGMAFPAPTPAGDPVGTEGVLPGLDFCNHARGAAVRWTVWGGRGADADPDTAAPPLAASLIAPAGAVSPGDELLIDYGDKTQEELLLLYGFAHAATAGGVLMVPCPLPASGAGWDADLEDRLELLRRRGLAPQVFLPADGPGGGGGARWPALWARWSGAAAPASGPLFDSVCPDLPPGVWATLEAFVLDPGDVRAALAATGGAPPPARPDPGLRMAVLTTLTRLLESIVLSLEGEGGTGSLEADVAALEADARAAPDAAAAAATAAAGGPAPAAPATIVSHMTPTARACVAYRASQKRAARLWLAEARRLLDAEVARLEKAAGGG